MGLKTKEEKTKQADLTELSDIIGSGLKQVDGGGIRDGLSFLVEKPKKYSKEKNQPKIPKIRPSKKAQVKENQLKEGRVTGEG